MKTLLLMRHAKSSWKDPDLSDRDRPLNAMGKKEVSMMGALILEKELLPQVILASSAERTRQTAKMLAERCDFKGEVKYLDSLYMAEPQQCLEAVKTLPNNLERVMLIGHNPGLEGLLQILSSRVESLPTGALAYLVLPICSWQELGDGITGELLGLWKPGDLKNGRHKK
jgi:phosphohistidine phosphatase